MLMKKLLLLLAAVFTAAISMTAQTGSLVREDRVWEYEGSIPIGPWFQYKMRFDGDTIVNGTKYNILHTFDGFTKEGPYEAKPSEGLDFFLREENGKVYLLVELYGPPTMDMTDTKEMEEKLLYDFNVETGDELNVVGSFDDLVNMTVTSTSHCNIDGEDCKIYSMNITDRPYLQYTMVEGIGNSSMGCIPYIITALITGGGRGAILPVSCVEQQLTRVYDNEGNIICEKDADGLWPWEKTDGVAELKTASKLSFDGRTVSANDEHLTIYAISGKVVAEGCGEVSTESLQPGVYVAKAGTKTLKILVK